MSDIITLGIDTSNYTTSAAIVKNGEVIYNGKIPLPVKEGERGLRQSDAVFSHTKNLPLLMRSVRDIFSELGKNAPNAIGCSASPRDSEGSYMPCFLAGKASAYSASAVCGADVYEFSHQAGHITAALYSAGKLDLLSGDEKFAAFHVSGGTTDIAIVSPKKDRFDVETVGGTNDLNAGQLIDRVGVYMGMKFPCGPALEAKASEFCERSKDLKISVDGLKCNLSGIENKAKALFDSEKDMAKTAAYTLDTVAAVLDRMTRNLRCDAADMPIIYAGGVMSCMRMRKILGKRDNVYFSEPQYSADNAAGIALLAYRRYTGGGEKL